jgi:hypothetical protein
MTTAEENNAWIEKHQITTQGRDSHYVTEKETRKRLGGEVLKAVRQAPLAWRQAFVAEWMTTISERGHRGVVLSWLARECWRDAVAAWYGGKVYGGVYPPGDHALSTQGDERG